MKTVIIALKIVLATALTILFYTSNVQAQCPAPYDNFPNFAQFNLTPAGVGDTNRVTSAWGNDFFHINADSGSTYVMSLCETGYFIDSAYYLGAPGIYYDPNMTLIKDTLGDSATFTPPSGVILAWNEDSCGVMPAITYTADFTGDIAIMIDAPQCDSFAVDSAIIYVTQIPTVTSIGVSLLVDNDSCNSGLGALTSLVSGNSGTISYLWSNGATTSRISGLTQGTYSQIVSDTSGDSDTAYATY